MIKLPLRIFLFSLTVLMLASNVVAGGDASNDGVWRQIDEATLAGKAASASFVPHSFKVSG